LDGFLLSGDSPSKVSPLKFGKECAIRLNVNPPPGKRLKRIIATTRIVTSKEVGAELLINGELKLGAASLGFKREIQKEGERFFKKTIPIHIDSQGLEASLDPMPSLACGAAKIIGFDYTFILRRADQRTQVSASLADEKKLEIFAELESCG